VLTPQGENNPPGLPAIAYRTGTWATFKESMLARLSSSDYPALAPLKTREDHDFTIALLDATAMMLDILTFYQERLANESYLRTAVQLRSLVELSRLIGYEPSPGVSATTHLAFTLKAATGLPADPSTPAITVPKGTRVQSVPVQGQVPQTFETSADVLAKPDWSDLAVKTGVPWVPQMGDFSVYLQGTATQLQPGDAILIVGDERLNAKFSKKHWDIWDLRLVTAVNVDSANNRTLVTWSGGLGDAAAGVGPAQHNPKFYALRQRAALFGYNAVNPLMLSAGTRAKLSSARLLNSAKTEWIFGLNPVDGSSLASDTLVDLDAVYSKLPPGSWLALIIPDKQTSRSPSGFVSLYLIDSVTTIARSGYSISSKISRLATDTNANLASYYDGTRSTVALTQSEALPAVEQPLDHPLYGAFIDLEELRPDLTKLQGIAVTGKAQKLSVKPNLSPALVFTSDDPTAPTLTLHPGDVVTVIDPGPLPRDSHGGIPAWKTSTRKRPLRVADSSGRTGTVHAAVSEFSLAPSASSDPVVQEYAPVSSLQVAANPVPHTRICLKHNLRNCYDRGFTTVNANVGIATAGQTTAEILGNGSASTPNQSFTLKQAPLTFVQAPTPTGRQSTLQVTANGVAWHEVPTLYHQGPTQQVFATQNQPAGVTQVLFGDGIEGSPLPTGQNNVQAAYRVGLGTAGNVAAGSITTPIDRPLGVSGVNNPQAATGGQDAQSVDDIRANAPLSVLTLGRAVSIEDYQNFAATFAGIAKAYAIWIPSGPGRGVFLTVAASGGVVLQPGDPTLANLVSALQDYGNPLIPITARSFLETLFSVEADLRCDQKHDATAVKAAVIASLAHSYGFASRTFGQGVSSEEIEAFIQAIPGVVAVNVTALTLGATSAGGDLTSGNYSLAAYIAWSSQAVSLPRLPSGSLSRICPYLPIANPTALPCPADILVLDPRPNGAILRDMP
jgi:hypothetical protein